MEIEPLPAAQYAEIRDLLLDLLLQEQGHFDHPRLTRSELDAALPPARPTFRGENHLFTAREGERPVGMCWCVLYDPGTGLEGEVAELYVDPAARRQGVGTRLLEAAVELFRRRGVTFAAVWTRRDNVPAHRLYTAAGFAPTEQTVLTWYPAEDSP